VSATFLYHASTGVLTCALKPNAVTTAADDTNGVGGGGGRGGGGGGGVFTIDVSVTTVDGRTSNALPVAFVRANASANTNTDGDNGNGGGGNGGDATLTVASPSIVVGASDTTPVLFNVRVAAGGSAHGCVSNGSGLANCDVAGGATLEFTGALCARLFLQSESRQFCLLLCAICLQLCTVRSRCLCTRSTPFIEQVQTSGGGAPPLRLCATVLHLIRTGKWRCAAC
jgi:hypothetical protein